MEPHPTRGGCDDWFFGVWQPPTVTDPATGRALDFADASLDLLRTEASCRQPEPDADWHGFTGLDRGHCMLDPIKVILTCPGIDATGRTGELGIPARILTSYHDAARRLVGRPRAVRARTRDTAGPGSRADSSSTAHRPRCPSTKTAPAPACFWTRAGPGRPARPARPGPRAGPAVAVASSPSRRRPRGVQTGAGPSMRITETSRASSSTW
ncbi:hypothetical protein [Embleya sp. NPDC050493]|uniref:hypothetical protein n=1 Tax=Embleya sp. NPDC050493 TaxID=3363989 RepID=UPI0037AF2DF2